MIIRGLQVKKVVPSPKTRDLFLNGDFFMSKKRFQKNRTPRLKKSLPSLDIKQSLLYHNNIIYINLHECVGAEGASYKRGTK